MSFLGKSAKQIKPTHRHSICIHIYSSTEWKYVSLNAGAQGNNQLKKQNNNIDAILTWKNLSNFWEITIVSSNDPPTVNKGTDDIIRAADNHHCIQLLKRESLRYLISGKVIYFHFITMGINEFVCFLYWNKAFYSSICEWFKQRKNI